jgi:hypothetical protein
MPTPPSEPGRPKPGDKQAAKDLYRRLRGLTGAQLLADEVPRFDGAPPRERVAGVAVVRAVGTVIAASGTAEQRDAAKQWLRGLLRDGEEKVRRYAADALAALGGDAGDEAALVALLRASASEREKQAVGRALGKVGSPAVLPHLRGEGALRDAERTLKARLAREQNPSHIALDATLADPDLRIHLRWRRGYEQIVASEVEARAGELGLRILAVQPGCVAVSPTRPLSLADLHRLRCFDTLGFPLPARGREPSEAAATALASPHARRLLNTLTRGPLRYRAEFVGQGHQRAAVKRLADRAYALWPELLNDPSAAPWTLALRPSERDAAVELVPHITPDPRLPWRLGDIPAASHPRLAACMARLAGPRQGEVVWDPCCGSGMELIERMLLGGVARALGSDVDEGALRIARANFLAAGSPVAAEFACVDFRAAPRQLGIAPGSVSLILTNPPMGRRVPTQDVHRLLADLFAVAGEVLCPGGRLVLPNPVRAMNLPAQLELVSRQPVDFGGFECRLEVWTRRGR